MSISGTSNVHDFTAVSTKLRLSSVALAAESGDAIDAALAPKGLTAFEVSVPATSLSSPRDGVDKNMHKALKADKNPEITFRLTGLDPGDAAGTFMALGTLRIAGVEREVVLPLTVAREGATLKVTGTVPVLMTDYGIAPPKAMLGMVKADPKVTVTFEIVLQIPQA